MFPLSALSFVLPIAIGTPQKATAAIGAKKESKGTFGIVKAKKKDKNEK
jgi:hypothetical protein